MRSGFDINPFSATSGAERPGRATKARAAETPAAESPAFSLKEPAAPPPRAPERPRADAPPDRDRAPQETRRNERSEAPRRADPPRRDDPPRREDPPRRSDPPQGAERPVRDVHDTAATKPDGAGSAAETVGEDVAEDAKALEAQAEAAVPLQSEAAPAQTPVPVDAAILAAALSAGGAAPGEDSGEPETSTEAEDDPAHPHGLARAAEVMGLGGREIPKGLEQAIAAQEAKAAGAEAQTAALAPTAPKGGAEGKDETAILASEEAAKAATEAGIEGKAEAKGEAKPEPSLSKFAQMIEGKADAPGAAQAGPAPAQASGDGKTAEAARPAPAQQPAQPATPPVPLGGVPIEIGLKALAGMKQFEIRLDPAELGRIDVTLEIGDGGEVKAQMVVDRVETLHLLQRDARTLERAFEQAGLRPSEGGVDLSLRDPSGGSRQGNQERQDQRDGQPSLRPDGTPRRDGAEVQATGPARGLWRGSTGLDVRV
ncbi:MAG TPA: flagellar hook-length control protein FliK [Microvirga sp.]|jgi:flagellar hook-length control protein FliK